MTNFLPWCGGLFLIGFFGQCGSVDRPESPRSAAADPPAARHLVRYLSDPRDSGRVELILRADSTFVLQITAQNEPVIRTFSGSLAVTDTRYQLFFPDTTTHFNELITPVHADASVITYPDYSVVLDKKLRQFYVRDVLITADSVDVP